MIEQQTALRIVGGTFLGCLGVRTCLSRPAEAQPKVSAAGLVRDYASTFGYTLTNPMTLLVFTALLASVGSVRGGAGASAHLPRLRPLVARPQHAREPGA